MSSSEHAPSTKAPDFPWPQSNGVWATYNLHCHCGAIRFSMKLSPPLYEDETGGKERYSAVECNCSHCDREGMINVHPLAENVEFTQGLEHRVNYYSGSKKNPHWFCGKCGSTVGTDLTSLMEMMGLDNRYAVNIRMLKDFDRSKLSIKPVTFMKDMPPKYEV